MRIHIKSLDDKSQAKILEDYKKMRKFSLVAKKWDIDFRTIRDFIKQQDPSILPPKIKITGEIENEVVNLYKNKTPLYKINNITNIPYHKIKKIIKNKGVELHGNRWYEYNEHFFDAIDTEEKAYWLGFIYADGGVYENNKTCSLTIKLAEKDIDHLERLKLSMSAENPIKKVKTLSKFPNGNSGVYYSVMLRFTSKHLFNRMNECGCVANKSLKVKFPSDKIVLPEFINHFIRGYFDGDGSISMEKSNNQPHFNLLGSKSFLSEVQKIFVDNCGLSYTKLSSPSKIHSMNYGGRLNCKAIRDYLYKDATIYLDRKYNIFMLI